MLKSESIEHFESIEIETKSEQDVNDKKYYSILPDLATGWRPKNIKIAAPILITYEDEFTNSVFENALASMNKVVFIGSRYDNSYKFHSLTQHNYNVKYGLKCDEVPTKLQKELEEFTIKSNNKKGLFSGMNPNLDKELQFESSFESGNLDLVVKVSDNEYNLFLRPDTNTCGHMQWFYFKINNRFYSQQKIKINICNNKKQGVLFVRGMKPYVYSKYLEQTRGLKWQQGGENVNYQRLSEKEEFMQSPLKPEEVDTEMASKYFCLSFEYTFESSNDDVYFSYCPPYTYSDMKSHIQSLKKRSNPVIGFNVVEENLCNSLSGLEIPVLTITDQSVNETEKKCVMVTGRFHPGESNGSYVLKGFMEFLASNEAEELRKKIVFKIVPMINPDGVVFGNYRTSLSGKDLNRKFRAKNIELFPEINHLKSFVSKLKKESKMKILYFLDFHGHSIKKNIFLYGPEYDIWSSKFEKAKILPRVIAQKTNMFRYQSCLFRVAAAKKTTARAFMLDLIPYCYTIESSVGLFRAYDMKDNFCFGPAKWEEAGFIIGDSLKESLYKVEKEPQGNQKKKKKTQKHDENDNKENYNKMIESEPPKIKGSEKIIERETVKDRVRNKEMKEPQKESSIDQLKCFTRELPGSQSREKSVEKYREKIDSFRSSSSKSIRDKEKASSNPINLSMKNTKFPLAIFEVNFPQINEVDGESDGYSEGKSDCESDDNDFNKEEYKKITGRIMKIIDNFNLNVFGSKNRNFRLKNNRKKVLTTSKNKFNMALRKTSEDMKMVPSLKHKMLIKELTEKRIFDDELLNEKKK